MAEPESWEDTEGTTAPSAQSHRALNPNAASFAFNPSAPSFTPSFDHHSGYIPPVSVSSNFSTPSSVALQIPVASTLSASSAACVEPVVTSSDAPLATDGSASSVIEGSDFASDVVTSGYPDGSNSEDDQKVEGELDVKGKTQASENGDITDKTGLASSLASTKVTETEEMKVDEDQERVLYEDDRIEQEEDIEEELEESQHLNVVFIGHVDAGKSTIGGQILFLTNMVDERTIQKYEREAKEKNRESWYMAYIMDTNEEERAKGKTVEVGRASFAIEKKRFTILDAPGHKNYVPNMISGASQADIGVLVISARKGEFETGFERGGQTREHVQLAKTLGVSKLLVVVNKMDDPSVQWSKERFNEIEKKIIPFLRSCGYNVKKDVQFLPISGLLGSNLKDRVLKSVCPWWDGQCLFEALSAIEPPVRDRNGLFRMPLIDRFKDMGTVVMGKIESGTVRRGDNLVVMPNKVNVKVVTVYRDSNEVNLARPGENLRIRLSGIEEEDISPGFVLSGISRPISAVLEFDAQLQILELLDHKAIFTAGYKAVLHIHAVVEECEIIEILQQIDPKTKKPMKKKVLFVKSGAVVVVRIQVNEPICVERFEDFPQLGRFTLRDEGKTVAIGKVVSLPAASNSE